MISVTHNRALIYMAIGFAMLVTFQDLLVSFFTYMAGGLERTSPVFPVPLLSLTLVGLMMPVDADPNARPAWWHATFGRQLALFVVLSVPAGAGLIALRHTPELSTTIIDLFIEALFIAMLTTVPRPDASSDQTERSG